ncbi:glycosyltransferase family 4 protein [Halomonas daqingensis]|uniref:Glycosyltransferase family 4 protein n=2 Tax=Billgrantia desiderata TaxID=52021 RepID=A0ABS9B0T0_9GAMM|nr:glycosyltransferase family 4 protein [Halomonas desiderata]MCE8045286.1 glycosyltransferase family 4 protein [Halomonas desiderata]
MRIVVDKTWFGLGGIGRFSEEVIARLSYDADCKLSCHPASFMASAKLSRSCKRNMVAFLPGFVPPAISFGSYVFTIHDLNHLDRPENSSLGKRLFYRFVIRRGCKKAYAILTVSEFSRKRIVEWAGVSSDKVVNVGNGVDKSFNSDVIPYNLGTPYYLCVGNRKAHKNETRVVEAFAQADIDEGIHLVFTGASEPSLEAMIQEHNLSSRVKFMGTVTEDELPSLYKGARGLLFPSLYEGFGLPVLEAMACGTPVITSNCTSLPEVAGDAAMLVDPLDTQELQDAIERLEQDASLRDELIVKGFDRAKLFTWEKTAQKVQEVLDSARNA